MITDDAIAYTSTSNIYLTEAGHGACTQSLCMHDTTPRPEGEEQACEFRKFLYRAYTLPFDCIKHVNS